MKNEKKVYIFIFIFFPFQHFSYIIYAIIYFNLCNFLKLFDEAREMYFMVVGNSNNPARSCLSQCRGKPRLRTE